MRRTSSGNWGQFAVALATVSISMATATLSHAQGAPLPPESALPPSQDPPPPSPPAPAGETPLPAPSDSAWRAPQGGVAVAQVPAAAGRESDSDFNVELRRWGVGYAGVSLVPTGAGSLTVPAVGLRYWANPNTGVDVALGVGWTGGSTDTAGTSMDKNTVFGVIVQGGVPFVLSTHRHVNFEVMPYLTVAYGKTSTGTGAAEIDYSGLRVDVGLRAGFELFFGFIGIPELALSATVGAQFEYLKNDATDYGLDASDTTYSLSTTVQNNPWDIFAGNVAARYYF
jgi:hypothetical protein